MEEPMMRDSLGTTFFRPLETQEDREQRYLDDRTCFACGDTSGWQHDCSPKAN